MTLFRVACVLPVALAMLWAAPSGAQPTREKCSCDLGTPGDVRDGAEITNAGTCFLTEDDNTEWCAFQIETLADSAAHGQIAQKLSDAGENDDRAALVDLLETTFTTTLTEERFDAFLRRRFDQSVDAVLARSLPLIGANAGLLVDCARTFAKGSDDDNALLDGGDDIGCGVHPGTGWFTLFISFDNFDLYYLIGPT